MICAQTNHTLCCVFEDPTTRHTTLSQAQRTSSATDAPLPLLAAITAELRLAGEVDELPPLRTARRLLEEAFRAVDDTPVMTDPKPSHPRKEPAMDCQRN